jgi:hypothetical protein
LPQLPESAASRLVAAAHQMSEQTVHRAKDSGRESDQSLLLVEPTDVFEATIRKLRKQALLAEHWDDDGLAAFTSQPGLILAGLRALSAHVAEEDDHRRRECEELLARCQQPDPKAAPTSIASCCTPIASSGARLRKSTTESGAQSDSTGGPFDSDDFIAVPWNHVFPGLRRPR